MSLSVSTITRWETKQTYIIAVLFENPTWKFTSFRLYIHFFKNVDFHNSPFHIVCLVAKPLNRSEAKVDLIMIQTLLLFIYKLLCYHAN